ncbi:MAG: SoxR reducing system RseC family protein [Zymomonas mobilis]|uniref:RseC/MucC-like positive regulator of sigma(E) n=1 Tax=Zymomonas mobilis TaxID=542 RepID=A0A542W3J1_ZYMMB|nr:SoxR reducing system RseC family protein [Zymomonas mobilis]TQL18120.1 RseC/MucC-like positive regulator of sigma(E) [Zymomonas mobilis]
MSGDFSKLSTILPDDLAENSANNLESCAKVVAVDKDTVWLEPDLASGCAGCSHSAGCLSALTKKTPAQSRRFTLPNNQDFQLGEQVIVATSARLLVKTALFSYGMPLLTLLAFALVAKYSLGFGDGLAALASLLGLGCGFICVWLGNRYFTKNNSSSLSFVRRVAD